MTYGRDTYCDTAIRSGRFVTGRLLVGQRCWHRLITKKGSLRGGEDEADWGIDLLEEIGRSVDSNVEARLPGIIKGELIRDEQVVGVEVAVSRSTETIVQWNIAIRVWTDEGAVDLLLSASEVTVDLVGLGEVA